MELPWPSYVRMRKHEPLNAEHEGGQRFGLTET